MMNNIIDIIENYNEHGQRVLHIVEVPQPPAIPNDVLFNPLIREAHRLGKRLEGDFVTGEVRFVDRGITQ